MKLHRRGFLASLTGAVAAGPSAAKEIVSKNMNSLSLSHLGATTNNAPIHDDMPNDTSWARKALKRLRNEARIPDLKREYNIYELDPNTASLHSVSLSNKIRISKERQFNAYRKQQMSLFERILRGED